MMSPCCLTSDCSHAKGFQTFRHLAVRRTDRSQSRLFLRLFSSSTPVKHKLPLEIAFLTSISIVNSNSVMMIQIRVFFETVPLLPGSPPKASNASRYSSPSALYSSLSSSSLIYFITLQRVSASIVSLFLISRSSFKYLFNYSNVVCETWCPHAKGSQKKSNAYLRAAQQVQTSQHSCLCLPCS